MTFIKKINEDYKFHLHIVWKTMKYIAFFAFFILLFTPYNPIDFLFNYLMNQDTSLFLNITVIVSFTLLLGMIEHYFED